MSIKLIISHISFGCWKIYIMDVILKDTRPQQKKEISGKTSKSWGERGRGKKLLGPTIIFLDALASLKPH